MCVHPRLKRQHPPGDLLMVDNWGTRTNPKPTAFWVSVCTIEAQWRQASVHIKLANSPLAQVCRRAKSYQWHRESYSTHSGWEEWVFERKEGKKVFQVEEVIICVKCYKLRTRNWLWHNNMEVIVWPWRQLLWRKGRRENLKGMSFKSKGKIGKNKFRQLYQGFLW